MKKTFNLMMLALGVSFIMLSSCNKDDDNFNNTDDNTNPTNFSFDVGSSKTASFFGQIINENNQPISGVNVSVGNKNTTTNSLGVFFIENVNVFERLAYVKAERAGYFLGSRSVKPTDGVNKITIKMLPKTSIGSVDASTGGSVSDGDITIDFAGGFVDAQGNPFTGQVQIAAQYLNPEAADFSDIMPGNLIAVDGANNSQYLMSYGMVAVELTGNGGKLQLADGSPATVTFPVPNSLSSSAPTSIDLWSFDEAKGYWIFEGVAEKVGNEYVAEVSHFSFWNCDIPTDYTTIEGQILDENQNPVSGLRIRIVSENWGTGFGWTDDNGMYSGIVPANDQLTIEVDVHCGDYNYENIYSESIGAISSPTTLPAIVLNSISGSTVVVSGTVLNCNQALVDNGYITYGTSNQIEYLSNGTFSFVSCGGTDLDISAVDIDNLTTSGTITYNLPNNDLDVGQIIACNDLTEFILWEINGESYQAFDNLNGWSQGGGFIGIQGGSPNFAYIQVDNYNGPGEYPLDLNNFTFELQGYEYVINPTGELLVTINQFGTNSGDLIDGSFEGTVVGVDSLTNTITQEVNGIFHFFQP